VTPRILTSEDWKREAQVATVMSLFDDVNQQLDVSAVSAATGLATTPSVELLGEMVKRGFLRPAPGDKWERGYVQGKLEANRFQRRRSAQEEVHEAIGGYLDEGELVRAWVMVVEVADAKGTSLMHRAGGGDDGSNRPTVWEVIGMLRSGERLAEDQLAEISRDA
jgi:hypothetical protein